MRKKQEELKFQQQAVSYDEAGEKEVFNQITEAYQSGVVEQIDEDKERNSLR
ncbi:hypothetical protein LC040_13120 [Bacillus tianshenii]|nr:hypothetical protein LC040_13120 [Bacillus tianshenii]